MIRTWQGVWNLQNMCWCYYHVAVFFLDLHFHDLVALITHLMLWANYFITPNFYFGHQIFIQFHHFTLTLLIPRHKPKHYHIPQGHIGISLHHTETYTSSVYLSDTHTLMDTYIHLLVSCCHLDPDHITSSLICSGFTCPASAAEPESLCLRAFCGCWSLPCPCLPQAGHVGGVVHISGSSPQQIASGRWNINTPAFLPFKWQDSEACSVKLPRVPQQEAALVAHRGT